MSNTSGETQIYNRKTNLIGSHLKASDLSRIHDIKANDQTVGTMNPRVVRTISETHDVVQTTELQVRLN